MTGMPRPPVSPLGKFAASMRDSDPDGAWKLAERMWKEHGIAIFVIADVDRKKGWGEARNARTLAENCYGKIGAGKK